MSRIFSKPKSAKTASTKDRRIASLKEQPRSELTKTSGIKHRGHPIGTKDTYSWANHIEFDLDADGKFVDDTTIKFYGQKTDASLITIAFASLVSPEAIEKISKKMVSALGFDMRRRPLTVYAHVSD